MKMKKKLLLTLTTLLITNYFIVINVYSQTGGVKVKSGTSLKVKSGTSLKIARNLNVSTGALMSIQGDVTVNGSATGTDNTAIVIYSTSAINDGSFIFGSGSPNATVQRYITNNVWHQVSMPVSSGGTTNDFHFAFNPRTWLTHWNETTGEWEYLVDTTETRYLGEGYDYYVENTNVTVDFAGPLSSNNFSVNGSTTPAITNVADGYNLIGNPYTSALSVDDDGNNNWTFTDLEKTIWVLDQSGGAANYVTRAVAAGTGSLTDGIIPMGQGFFIHATGSSPLLTIPAARRIHSNQKFYKSAGQKSKYYNVDSYFVLDVTKNNTKDEIWVTFAKNGTDGFDNGFDASKLYGNEGAPQLYINSVSIEKPLSILHLHTLEERERVVELDFKAGSDGQQVFTANTTGLENCRVFLEDRFTGKTQNLNEQNSYIFISSKNDDPNRFLLHFYNTTGIDDPQNGTKGKFLIYAWNKQVYIKNNTSDFSGKINVSIFDLSGRMLINKKFTNSSLIRIPVVNRNNTILIVRIMTDNILKTTKVIIN